MKLLKNKRQWRAWSNTLRRDFAYTPNPIAEPTAYPCYAYAVLGWLDCGMEECVEEPRYLYASDVETMYRDLIPPFSFATLTTSDP